MTVVAVPDFAIGEPGERVTIMTPATSITIWIDADGDARIIATSRRELAIAPLSGMQRIEQTPIAGRRRRKADQ